MKTFKRIRFLANEVLGLAKLFDRKIVVADIGTDHGYLPELLSKQNEVEKIIATDISEKSLAKLEKLIVKESLEKIETKCGEGLLPIKSVDVAVVAGIGGEEIIKILKNQNDDGKNNFKCKLFVLQPAQNVKQLRDFIFERKLFLIKDFLIEDSGRFYHFLIVDVSRREKNKANIFNRYLGRDNTTQSEDFLKFLKECYDGLLFIDDIAFKRVKTDKVLLEKYKLKKIIKKLLCKKEMLC